MVAPDELGRFLKRFCDLYMLHRHGAKYIPNKPRDVPALKVLLTEFGFERLEKLAVLILTTDEQWIADSDRGIGVLRSKATWADDRLRTRGL